ncbi:MAG TPA: hypothetical protein VLD63_08425 [Anaerolineales bacterium]|nr:hypothetical protein [Anaerolineales bacterium]
MTTADRRWRISDSIRIGLVGGIFAVYLCLIGIVEALGDRSVIEKLVSVGQTLLLLTAFGTGYFAAQQALAAGASRKTVTSLLASLLAGLGTGLLLGLLVLLGYLVNVRAVFINVSPALLDSLTLGLGISGVWLPVAVMAFVGLMGGVVRALPASVRSPLIVGLGAVVLGGLFSGLVRPPMIALKGTPEKVARFLMGPTGLTPWGAVIVFAVVAAIDITIFQASSPVRKSYRELPPNRRKIARGTLLVLAILMAIVLPRGSGPFIAQVVVLICLSALMGLGMNITLGFAGLLDLGFVAFFAVGAYTVGMLTSYGEFGLAHLPFWVVLPIAVLVAMLTGAFLGLPVLGIRGDYLAIATLGFGEVVRLLAGSDFLAPWLGGPQGVIGIQKPCLGWLGPFVGTDVPRVCHGIELGGPKEIYYLALICVLIVALVAIRLRDSRLGRAWMAIREDEDVAQGLGVNLIQTKLMAYVLGASFAGLSGAIFAVLVGSIFASSMQLLVSINVVAIVVVGGMGSIPGVIVGSLALIGLPEAFREFSAYRLLFYGAALIVVMIARPAGLWPSVITKRELHVDLDDETDPAASPSAASE